MATSESDSSRLEINTLLSCVILRGTESRGSDRTVTVDHVGPHTAHPSPATTTTPMQVTPALKKRTPFALVSDEDNLPADAAVLDDQGEHRGRVA